MPGVATQIFSAEFDAALSRLPKNIAALIMGKIDDMGPALNRLRIESRPESFAPVLVLSRCGFESWRDVFYE
jgi:hypothetical protein